MDDTIRILVTLAEHADSGLVESALEDEPSLEVVGYADYLDDWREFLAQQADLVIVACSAADDDTTAMVDRAVKHRPDRPVVVMSESLAERLPAAGVRSRRRRRDHSPAAARTRSHSRSGR